KFARINNENTEQQAFLSTNRQPNVRNSTVRCFKCGREGHVARNCPSNNNRSYFNRNSARPVSNDDNARRDRPANNNASNNNRQRRIASYVADDVNIESEQQQQRHAYTTFGAQ
ncbi:hypothetical protein BLA29_014409, partial [Euroglyphus maynei]